VGRHLVVVAWDMKQRVVMDPDGSNNGRGVAGQLFAGKDIRPTPPTPTPTPAQPTAVPRLAIRPPSSGPGPSARLPGNYQLQMVS
jgi:hypothetical protein